MAEESSFTGGDAMSAYVTPAGSGGAGSSVDSATLTQDVAEIARLNGSATLVSQKAFSNGLVAIYKMFNATRAADKKRVDDTLIYYFSVHGTSPETLWGIYEHPIVALGQTVPAVKVVTEIGANKLKRFMGRFTQRTIEMYNVSPEMQGAVAERAARRGLANGQEVFAIDFLGKDGSLSPAESVVRVHSRDAGLHYRAKNANSLMEQKRAVTVNSNPDDARALGGAGNGNNTLTF